MLVVHPLHELWFGTTGFPPLYRLGIRVHGLAFFYDCDRL